MDCASHVQQWQLVLDLLEQMTQAGFKPTSFAYNTALKVRQHHPSFDTLLCMHWTKLIAQC